MSLKEKKTISAVLIVKNEEDKLGECLERIADWIDEIVVLDAGSCDKTVEIAKKFGAIVHLNSEWPGFGKQRQLAQTYVTSDYVFWLDADERVTPALASEIQHTVINDQTNSIFSINRLSWAFGQAIRHSGWFPDRVVRIYPTNLTQYDDALVHEKVIIPKGSTVKPLEGLVEHLTYDSLAQYLVKSNGYAIAWAEEKSKHGRKSNLSKATLHALGKFTKMYLLKAGFLDGRIGLLLALLSTYYVFLKYTQLWLLNRAQKR